MSEGISGGVNTGSVAIISGGLGDIGQAIALELARRGADIAVCDLLEPQRAEALRVEVEALGRRLRYDRVDVSDALAVARWVMAVEAELGVANLIVPNAAIVTQADSRAITPEQWSRELRVNLDGAFYLAQAGVARLLEHKRPGRVVFVGSWAAHAPHTHIVAYCAAKAGLRMLGRCMALELASHNILVNEVAPGYVDAGLSAQIFRDQPERRARAERTVPLGTLISAEEVAAQVAYLCDPANRQITGSVLLLDGGLSLLTAVGREDD
jgi:NAD(P)-dependent dehydrogenase (short-subunit alcohol dehydrogenase family)